MHRYVGHGHTRTRTRTRTRTHTADVSNIVAGVILYRGLYFGLYDSLKPVVLRGDLKDSVVASFVLGWGITLGAGLAAYPFDTICRRMMTTVRTSVAHPIYITSTYTPDLCGCAAIDLHRRANTGEGCCTR